MNKGILFAGSAPPSKPAHEALGNTMAQYAARPTAAQAAPKAMAAKPAAQAAPPKAPKPRAAAPTPVKWMFLGPAAELLGLRDDHGGHLAVARLACIGWVRSGRVPSGDSRPSLKEFRIDEASVHEYIGKGCPALHGPWNGFRGGVWIDDSPELTRDAETFTAQFRAALEKAGPGDAQLLRGIGRSDALEVTVPTAGLAAQFRAALPRHALAHSRPPQQPTGFLCWAIAQFRFQVKCAVQAEPVAGLAETLFASVANFQKFTTAAHARLAGQELCARRSLRITGSVPRTIPVKLSAPIREYLPDARKLALAAL